MDNVNKLTVETPMGTLVAYASTDPQNPGIFIDLQKDGIEYALNLAGTECQIPEDDGNEQCKLVSHIWGNGTNEDTTVDETHIHVDEYFQSDDE